MKAVPFQVRELIKVLDSKIPQRIGKETGVELMRNELVLWNMSVITELVPVYTTKSHRHRMEMAYLLGGCAAIWEYVRPFVKAKDRDRIKKIVMMPDEQI